MLLFCAVHFPAYHVTFSQTLSQWEYCDSAKQNIKQRTRSSRGLRLLRHNLSTMLPFWEHRQDSTTGLGKAA